MDVKIFLLPIWEAEKITVEYCKRHFPQRLNRAQKFVYRQDYLRCIGAGALIYGILGITEDKIECGKDNKPFSKGMHFNISHSGSYIALAVCSEEVGVDIEIIDKSHLQIADSVFTKDELTWFNKDEIRFHILWTLKESVMKQSGQGFGLPISSFSVMPLVNGEKLLFEDKSLFGYFQTIDGHVLSVCTSHKTVPTTQIISLNDLNN